MELILAYYRIDPLLAQKSHFAVDCAIAKRVQQADRIYTTHQSPISKKVRGNRVFTRHIAATNSSTVSLAVRIRLRKVPLATSR